MIGCVEWIERKVLRKVVNRKLGGKQGKDKKERKTGGKNNFS